MAKKKNEIDNASSALDKLYSKYSKTENVYKAPDKLEDIDPSVSRMKSPFLSFDRYLGGGPAYGKITTYSAFASMGKTSLALAHAGENPDKIVGFVDAEFNWDDASYLWVDKYFGIEKERIHILHPTYLEEGAEMIEDLCDACDIVIYDGFDSIAPKGEYEGSMEDNSMGLQARAYKKFFRRSMGKIYKSKAALIITNHLYENIGNMYEPFKEPGGKAIADYASQKLFLTRGNLKDSEKNITGQTVRVNVNKDKLTGSRGIKFEIPYDNKTGFDVVGDIINNAIDLGVIKQAGSWFSYDETKLGQGGNAVRGLLEDNVELLEEIVLKCKSLF
ncbi:recombinase A [Cellulophaga phage phi17:2_18]|uniref:Recombinase A n=2 Tax=Lightbulbvirus Cba172 TaxID=1918525 RepID=R9ZZD8_9CAUD|nr:recombinase A [Cellulophaga phage phi17:2]AGO47622.1 recombinase A [Cellulophaga phage phi17:2]ALO80492.1 recombinase A [Cellulophaga phage phi17:2_18]